MTPFRRSILVCVYSWCTYIPGVLNTASDELSRVGVCKAFYDAVRRDFPFVVDFQDMSEQLPPSIRSLEKLL